MRLPMRAIQKWVIDNLTEHFSSSDFSNLPFFASMQKGLHALVSSDADFLAALKRVQSASCIAKALTDLGIEVDAITGIPEQVFTTLDQEKNASVVVAYVKKTQPHPDAQKLQVATVFDGQNDYQVVCGARNCREGIYVVFAKEGAEIVPFSSCDEKKSILIEKANLRGVVSSGMLCAWEEIGFAPAGEGIIDLVQDLIEPEAFWKERIGLPAISILLNLQTRPCFELGLTPNLAHCFSARGVARELCASQGLLFFRNQKNLSTDPKSSKSEGSTCVECSRYCALKVHQLSNSCCQLQGFTPELEAPKIKIDPDADCYSYCGVIIEGIDAKNFDPDVSKRRALLLEDYAERSVDPLVDITNELMLDKGHPVHAFDLDKIEGAIQVRRAKQGEKAVTLDGIERKLSSSMTVIADEKKVLAIAGVMGCQSSCVDQNTKKLLLEVASFVPCSVRKTSRALSISTNSSKRFERGIDNRDCREVTQAFISRVLQLHRFKDAVRVGEVLRVVSQSLEWEPLPKVELPLGKIEDVLGFSVSLPSLKQKFLQIGIEVEEKNASTWICTPPSWRHDLTIAEDYIEEALKLHGIDSVPTAARPSFSDSSSTHDSIWSIERTLRHRLAAAGLCEIITPDLIDSDLQLSLGLPAQKIAKVLNPSNEQMNSCRVSMFPGALLQAKQMQDRGETSFAFFEIGSVYEACQERYREKRVLLVALSQHKNLDWRQSRFGENDFFDLKSLLTTCLGPCGHLETRELGAGCDDPSILHPGQRAQLLLGDEKNAIGVMGQIHPKIREKMQLQTGLYLAQIDLETLTSFVPSLVKQTGSSVSTQVWRGDDYPCMVRDVTIDASRDAAVAKLLQRFYSAKSLLEKDSEHSDAASNLRSIDLLSVFHPENESQIKRVTFRFVYRHRDRTLTQSEVDAVHGEILKRGS